LEVFEQPWRGDPTSDLDGSTEWDADAGGSDVDNEILYAGYRHDPETGLYHVRYRYHHPSLGRWITRDPGTGNAMRIGAGGAASVARFIPRDQYADGMNLYQYVRSNPANRRDWTGLASECYCGPDVTDFLADLINYANKWRESQGAISRAQGYVWLRANGMNFNWYSTAGQYKTQNCPSGKQCKNTYWLCGECVHDHWIGNFMYGYLGRLLHFPDWMMDTAADCVQMPGVGDDPTLNYSDPPWDTAGYGLGRIMHDELSNPNGKRILCQILKSDMGLWNAANNTAAVPPESGIYLFILGFEFGIDTTPNWPTPHATGYGGCEKCPEDLPATARNTVPGGNFGDSFPNVE